MIGDKCMPELQWKQPVFTYSAFGPFTKYRKRNKKFIYLEYLYRNELDKACFAHEAAYSYFKYLAKKTISDKILNDQIYEIAINRKYD